MIYYVASMRIGIYFGQIHQYPICTYVATCFHKAVRSAATYCTSLT
jgi:hypothetical protein